MSTYPVVRCVWLLSKSRWGLLFRILLAKRNLPRNLEAACSSGELTHTASSPNIEAELIALYLIKPRIISLTRADLYSSFLPLQRQASLPSFTIFHLYPTRRGTDLQDPSPLLLLSLSLSLFYFSSSPYCHRHRRFNHSFFYLAKIRVSRPFRHEERDFQQRQSTRSCAIHHLFLTFFFPPLPRNLRK